MGAWPMDDDVRAAGSAQRDHDAELRSDIHRFRQEAGLPADDETVESFVREYRAGRQEPGLWRTVEESRAIERREGLIEAGEEVVRSYVDRNRDVFAGEWTSWAGGSPTAVIAVAGDVDRHRSALADLHPHPEVVQVVERHRTLAELEGLMERAEQVVEELRGVGVEWRSMDLDIEANCVELEVIAPDEGEARRLLLERLGTGVRVGYLGPEQTSVEPVPWQVWSLDETGRELTVHYHTNATYVPDSAKHDEDDRSVRVTVFERVPVGPVRLPGATRHATVRLNTPLRTRVVIDASTGDERHQAGTPL